MADDELHWMSATELSAAIRGRDVSSTEVLEHLVDRIERLDEPINSVVQWDLERARAAAADADAAVARGDELGALHGVPMTIKDSFQTEGCITTSGSPELADFVPSEDAWPVARLREAGAIPFAKTNLPLYAGDIQTFNEVYGTTNNPYDLSRTPGGSSGGAAAALAMGFTPIELGSDIGGSIRVPAHSCGVVGHKSSFALVPGHGHIPGPAGTFTSADIGVFGPMARSVDDLELGLGVLAGPDRWNAPAWRLDLPPSTADGLADFRIAGWIDDPWCPVDADTSRVMSSLVDAIAGAGGRVDVDARPGFSLEQVSNIYLPLLFAALAQGFPPEALDHMAANTDDTPLGLVMRGTAMRHQDWLGHNERRLQLREKAARFFDDFDAILMPVHPCPAIPHDHPGTPATRSVSIDGTERSYMELFRWIALAGVAYLPSTVVPVGTSEDGLPIGVQIVGPYLHDRTTLRLAEHIEQIVHDRDRIPLRPPRAL
jgi:amidase